MIFLIGKLLFQPPEQGWATRGPRRNFCGIQWFFDILSFAQFFCQMRPTDRFGLATPAPDRLPGIFLFFLVRGFDRWMKKSQNQNSEESLSGLWATRFPTVDLNVLRSKRSTVVFQAKFMESRLRRKPKVSVLGRGLHIQKNRDWKKKLSETVSRNRPIVPTDETWI